MGILAGFRGRLSIFQRGFKRNFLASCINPVNIKWRVGRKKNLTWGGTETSGPMDMMTGHIHEIPMMSDESLVTLHLEFKQAAHGHHCFTGSMPMERSDTAWSKVSKDKGWPRARIASLNRYSEAFGSIRNAAELGAGSRNDNWFFFRSLGRQTASEADETHCTQNYRKNARALGKDHNASQNHAKLGTTT